MLVRIKNRWRVVKYTKNWNDLITKHGWTLEGITRDGHITMSRDGYINVFKEQQVAAK